MITSISFMFQFIVKAMRIQLTINDNKKKQALEFKRMFSEFIRKSSVVIVHECKEKSGKWDLLPKQELTRVCSFAGHHDMKMQ